MISTSCQFWRTCSRALILTLQRSKRLPSPSSRGYSRNYVLPRTDNPPFEANSWAWRVADGHVRICILKRETPLPKPNATISLEEGKVPTWVIPQLLARSSRPGYSGGRNRSVPAPEVDGWLAET